MEYEEIIEAIGREAAGLPPDVAERSAQAVLKTLAERLPRGEARHILAELPAELKPWVYTEADAEGFGIDEFLERVAKREGTDIETALRHARAVFAALGRALDADAVAHLAASLPQTFEPLVAEAQQRFLDIMPADEFWRRVGQRLGLDLAAARRITEAVLETLAERIAAGEVEDLVARLPGRAADAAGGVPAQGGRAGKRGRGRSRAGGRDIQACPGGVRDAGRGG